MKDIDLVIPMVFPEDPQWQEQYARYYGSRNNAVRMCRWRSWGTEELLVRCCQRYMPWLRRIYILLAGEGQVQPWMRDCSFFGVTLIFHADFIPKEHLPCFASPCIEMFLDRIPGLSERFIYANDDMFPLSPMEEDDFFRDGLPCQHYFQRAYPGSANVFHRKCMYQQNMVGAPFGIRHRTVLLRNGHGFAPILKSSCHEIWRRHGQEILRCLSPLKRTDRSFNHYLYTLYQYFSGQYVDHVPRTQLITEETPVGLLSAIVRDPHAGIVCFQDNAHTQDWERRAEVLRREIEAKLIHNS